MVRHGKDHNHESTSLDDAHAEPRPFETSQESPANEGGHDITEILSGFSVIKIPSSSEGTTAHAQLSGPSENLFAIHTHF